MTSQPLRVAGVPEHFNLPWHLAEEQGLFAKHGVQVEFVVVKEGTGAMIQAAAENRVDVIVALTEGLVASIAKGSDLRLLGTYVSSPLCWAVVSGAHTAIQSIDDLRGGTIAISRYGSGSHLMACVLAVQRGWDPSTDLKFVVAGDFKSLRAAVNNGTADAFMWETFTTKPFCDSGEVRRVGDITTPWPCFMLAARQEVVTRELDRMQRCFAAVHEAAEYFHREHAAMPAIVAQRFQLQPADAAQWYSTVRIAAEKFLSEAALTQAVAALISAAILPAGTVAPPAALVDGRLGELRTDIKSMRLYNRPELLSAMYRRLAAAGLSKGPCSFRDLLPFDQHHYHGVAALQDMQGVLGITASSKVINIGAGLGGPARFLAGTYGCQVLAIELQDDLHHAASELTVRCGLSGLVHHVAGDFLQIAQHLRAGSYDYVVSWLTILHFADRPRLFRDAAELLRPGGAFFAADFVQREPLSEDEWKVLHADVACPGLAASPQAYCDELAGAGLQLVRCDDETQSWGAFTRERVAAMQADADLQRVLGADVAPGLLYFYSAVRDLFNGGHLGGLSVYASKPVVAAADASAAAPP